MDERALRIRKLIEESDKSYQELEKITGIKKSSLQRYASGKTAKIPLSAIECLAKAFSVSTSYLMGWEEVQKKNDALTDIILEMRSDDEFLSIVEAIYKMDRKKRSSLLAFLK